MGRLPVDQLPQGGHYKLVNELVITVCACGATSCLCVCLCVSVCECVCPVSVCCVCVLGVCVCALCLCAVCAVCAGDHYFEWFMMFGGFFHSAVNTVIFIPCMETQQRSWWTGYYFVTIYLSQNIVVGWMEVTGIIANWILYLIGKKEVGWKWLNFWSLTKILTDLKFQILCFLLLFLASD